MQFCVRICFVVHYVVSFLVLQIVSWVGLRCVIVVFPDHTHFLSFAARMCNKLTKVNTCIHKLAQL